MRRIVWLALSALAILVVGCGQHSQEAFRRPKKFYRDIVSLSPGATEIIFQDLQVAGQTLKGRTESCNYPQGIQKVPVVTKRFKPDYELLASMKPDLIVYDATLYNDSDVEKLKELGIELFALQSSSLKEFRISLYKLGAKTRSEQNISEYDEKIQAAMDKAAGSHSGPKKTVAVIMPGNGAEHMIAGVDSFQSDIVRASGGTAVGPKASRFVQLDPEALIQWNPDVILVAGPISSVAKDPRLQNLKAVKGNQVLAVSPDIILRAGSRVDTVINGISGQL
jgi:iron complex transport system substrate-binding protein